MSFSSSPSGSYTSSSAPPLWSNWGVFDVEEHLILDGGHITYKVVPGELMLARYSVESQLKVQGVPIQDGDHDSHNYVNSVLYFLEHTDIANAELAVDGVMPAPLQRLLASVNSIYVAHGQPVPYPTVPTVTSSPQQGVHSLQTDLGRSKGLPASKRRSLSTHIRRASLMLSSVAAILTCGCLSSNSYSKSPPADYSEEWIIVPDPKRLSTSDASISSATSLLYPPTPSVRRTYGTIPSSIILTRSTSPVEHILSPREEKLPKLKIKHHRNSSSTSSLPIAPALQTRSKIRPKTKVANSLGSVTDECEPLLQ
ncbi:hypothetical protein BKA62DRAFT_716217 [Auriculariales sp. MPI-PUGE-AT-0066]|nr:hypothetical protein BKA62DRAFT_716217 [Auriculariales sp. MPI-PUGE-AT-0066]